MPNSLNNAWFQDYQTWRRWEVDDFENSIGQALSELESNSNLKANLRDLHITRACEIEQQKTFQKIQIILGRKLEKKFYGKQALVITYIFGTNTRNRARPRTFSKLWSA